jgi:hypothetical protein
MRGAIPPLPQYAFMAWCSVKAQGQLYLYLYLCLTKYDSVKTYCGSGGIAPLFLNLGTGWRWAVSFTPGDVSPSTRWIWDCVGLRASLNYLITNHVSSADVRTALNFNTSCRRRPALMYRRIVDKLGNKFTELSGVSHWIWMGCLPVVSFASTSQLVLCDKKLLQTLVIWNNNKLLHNFGAET